MGAGGGASSQAACLKQILLLQLDLIEQQQQQLQAKEKEIEELKAERDTVSWMLGSGAEGVNVHQVGGSGAWQQEAAAQGLTVGFGAGQFS